MSLDMEDLVPVEEQEDIPKEGDIEAFYPNFFIHNSLSNF